jgi:2'-5' RNA ligase
MADMYFIALVLPTEIDEHILKWKLFMKERFNCSVALRSPAHITLVTPFWMASDLEDKLEESMSQFSNRQPPFEVHLKNFAAFKPTVIYVDVLPSPALQTLHDQLHEYIIVQNLFPVKKEERPFHPHVTIATRDLHKKAFYEAWETFKRKNYEALAMIREISLLKHNQKNWDVIFTSQFKTS